VFYFKLLQDQYHETVMSAAADGTSGNTDYDTPNDIINSILTSCSHNAIAAVETRQPSHHEQPAAV
jgi:hypothetical protein